MLFPFTWSSLIAQDVFLTVRRKKLTLFLDAKENTSVLQLKQVIQGITRRKAEDMKLLRIGSNEPLDDKKSLVECGYDSQSCRAQDPQTIGLVFRVDGELRCV